MCYMHYCSIKQLDLNESKAQNSSFAYKLAIVQFYAKKKTQS